MQNIHASSVLYKGRGILFLGSSGVGKSDICLRLIGRGATLIADDRTDICVKEGKIYASCPKIIEGLLEIRGIGIRKFEFVNNIPISLVVELVKDYKQVERMPEDDLWEFDGVKVSKFKLCAFEASVLDKIDVLLG